DIDAGLHGAADIGSPAVPDHEDIAPRRISQPGEGDIEVFAGWFGETDLLGDDDLGNVAAKRGAGDASARDDLQAVGQDGHLVFAAEDIKDFGGTWNRVRAGGEAFEIDGAERSG